MNKQRAREMDKPENGTPDLGEAGRLLSDHELEWVSGGLDSLRLLAQVAHNQTEDAADDLDTIAEVLEAAVKAVVKNK
jgi:hypothetical protein